MIDLTPLDVRKKKGDFRRAVRGYDAELVDDFLDMVAERLEELVKQNVALTERAEHLQEQVASYREREKALNEALVTAQQLRSEAQAQADREADLVRREAQGQAERIIEEGQRSFRELARQIEGLQARKTQFVREFRSLLERFGSDLEVEEARPVEPAQNGPIASAPAEPAEPPTSQAPEQDEDNGVGVATEGEAETEAGAEENTPAEPKQSDWLSALVRESDQEEQKKT
jgi:DivIVA domain-containing protein